MPPILKICQVLEYGKIMNCEYVRVKQGACLNKPKYSLIMPQYALICLNNAEYASIYLNIPE